MSLSVSERMTIAIAFKAALVTFRGVRCAGIQLPEYHPSEGEISDPFFRPLTNSIVAQLAKTECLQTRVSRQQFTAEWPLPLSSLYNQSPREAVNYLTKTSLLSPVIQDPEPICLSAHIPKR